MGRFFGNVRQKFGADMNYVTDFPHQSSSRPEARQKFAPQDPQNAR
jgi:hypothetical protein